MVGSYGGRTELLNQETAMTVRRWRRKLANGEHTESWAVDLYLHRPDGTKKRVRRFPEIPTKIAAERLERKILTEFYKNHDVEEKELPPAIIPTLEDFWNEFFTTHVLPNNKPSERESKSVIYRCHLRPAFGRMTLDAITSRDIERYKAHKLSELGYVPKSINNHLAVLRSLLNVAKRWNILNQVPEYRELKSAEQAARFLSLDEAKRLMDAAEGKWKGMITLCLNTGLRIGELLALQWQDINFKTKVIRVQRNAWRNQLGSPKGGKSRDVAVNTATMVEMLHYPRISQKWVFSQNSGLMLTHAMCRRPLHKACRKAGITLLQWHALRHTFASQLVAGGAPLRVVQRLLGHASYATTERYAHLAPKTVQDAVDRLLYV
jgi:integrase